MNRLLVVVLGPRPSGTSRAARTRRPAAHRRGGAACTAGRTAAPPRPAVPPRAPATRCAPDGLPVRNRCRAASGATVAVRHGVGPRARRSSQPTGATGSPRVGRPRSRSTAHRAYSSTPLGPHSKYLLSNRREGTGALIRRQARCQVSALQGGYRDAGRSDTARTRAAPRSDERQTEPGESNTPHRSADHRPVDGCRRCGGCHIPVHTNQRERKRPGRTTGAPAVSAPLTRCPEWCRRARADRAY